MAFDMFKRLGSIGKRAQSVSASVSMSAAETLGINKGLPSPIAIDFGVGSLKVLQLTQGLPPTLVSAAALNTPDELLNDHEKRLEFQFAALPKLIKHAGFKGKRAVCAIPAWQTMCKQLQFPRTEGVPIADLVGGALAMQLGVDPGALVYRHIEVNPGMGGKAEVIAIASAREAVNRLMEVLQIARLEPVGIHSEFAAILRAFDHVTSLPDEKDRPVMYMDIGASLTKVMIAHGTHLVFARNVEMGGRSMDEMIVRQLKCELLEARKERLEADERLMTEHAEGGAASKEAPTGEGSPGDPAVATMESPASRDFVPPKADLTEAIETLVDEAQMCLRYYASHFPGRKVERVVFVGGESRNQGLCRRVARNLRLPAQLLDPMARVGRTGNEPVVGVNFGQPQPGWAVVLGLCLSPTDL